jgi:hypothetical protein
MRSHELELISALVEGTLEDETEARALIASSSELKEEYEAQKAARAALLSISPASLTEAEKATLHREVWTELRSQPPAAVRTPWYYRWVFSGAAVLLVGIGLFAVLNQGVADEAGVAVFEDSAEDLTEGGTDSASPMAGDDGAGIEAVETTEATSADEAMADDSAATYFSNAAAMTRSGRSFDPQGSDAEQSSFAEEHAQCLTEAELDGYVAIGIIDTADAKAAGLDTVSPFLVAIPDSAVLEENTPVAFVETNTCRLVHLDE